MDSSVFLFITSQVVYETNPKKLESNYSKKLNWNSTGRVSGFWINTPANLIEYSIIYYLTTVFVTIVFCLLSLVLIFRQKKLKTLAGKNLFSLIVSIFISHVLLACELLNWNVNYIECYLAAAIAQWGEMSIVLWFNVFAFDIWRSTFQMLNHDAHRDITQLKWYIYYCLFAWGFSFLFVGASVVIDNIDSVPTRFRPGYVDDKDIKCWTNTWQYSEAIAIYATLPFTVSLIVSVIFLLLAFVNIRRMAKQAMQSCITSRLRHRFMLYVQLTAVRDVLYIINYMFPWQWKGALFGSIIFGLNKLLGVYLFFLFVFNVKKTKSCLFNFATRAKDSLISKSSVTDTSL